MKPPSERHVAEAPAAPDDYGEWLRIETPSDYVYVWSCGCCGLHVQDEAPDDVQFEFAPPTP